jgi:hypothetical protein
MKQEWIIPLTIGLIATIAIAVGASVSHKMIGANPFEAKDLFQRNMDKPVIWIFYDTSIPNTRQYSDFQTRSSRALNLPFLNLCYESIAKQNSSTYRIEAISGLDGLAQILGGWDKLPSKLQNPLVTLEPSDMAWIRSAVLAKFGGLWVSPATICIKPFGLLPAKPVFFGTDSDESFAGTAGTACPNFQVAWSPSSEDPFWVAWEAKSRVRLNSSGGGDTARSADKWEFIALSKLYPDIEVRPLAEIGRKGAAGRKIQLEDILASGQEGDLPFEISVLGVYVAIPWPELKNRRAFGWFLRMSENQIAESDLVIRDLYKMAGVL